MNNEVIYRYFIKISFDGTAYNGWQVQKNSSQTVQQKINDGLSQLLNEKIEVHETELIFSSAIGTEITKWKDFKESIVKGEKYEAKL